MKILCLVLVVVAVTRIHGDGEFKIHLGFPGATSVTVRVQILWKKRQNTLLLCSSSRETILYYDLQFCPILIHRHLLSNQSLLIHFWFVIAHRRWDLPQQC